MLELICHERYRVEGIPVDIGPYRNHGRRSDTAVAPGVAAGQTAIGFPNPASRVSIARSGDDQWTPLVALRVEVRARVNASAARNRTLVDGGSFRFGILEGALDATFVGPPTSPTHVRSDETFAPDGAFHKVPADRWVTLAFDHDGYSAMQLVIDGKVVGRTAISAGVPPVGASGVSIGNRLAAAAPLHGDIDEVQIWRSYPKEIRNEFWCRPFSRGSAQCWEKIFRDLADWAAKHPGDAASLGTSIESRMRAIVAALFTLPPAEQARIRDLLRSFMQLWCAGQLGDDAMRAVLEQLIAALRRDRLDGALRADAEVLAIQRRIGFAVSVDCDPALAGFLALLDHAIQT
jgi:Concanavalin A-like lectin/glucanases superfamily